MTPAPVPARLADVLTRRPLLVYGIGNVGRQDDGVGPLLVDQVAARGVPGGVTLDSGYQLVPEDALLLSTHAAVLFVDASVDAATPHPYGLDVVAPASEIAFTSHALSPGALLSLCQRLYGARPDAWVLTLPAREFEVNAAPGAEAARCLALAVDDVWAALAAPIARR